MNKNFTKILKTGLISLSILFTTVAFTHTAQAINKCAGEAVSISWSSANVADVTCNFRRTDASFIAVSNGSTPETPNTSGTGAPFDAPNVVGLAGTITLTCTNPNTNAPVTSGPHELNIVNEPRCCAIGTAQTEGRTVWNGSTCACPNDSPWNGSACVNTNPTPTPIITPPTPILNWVQYCPRIGDANIGITWEYSNDTAPTSYRAVGTVCNPCLNGQIFLGFLLPPEHQISRAARACGAGIATQLNLEFTPDLIAACAYSV